MSDTIPRYSRPELFFGFVAPIGSNLHESLAAFHTYLSAAGYRVEDIHVTDAYRHFRELIPPEIPLEHKRVKERYSTHIAYGNQLRKHFGDDSILAAASIVRLQRKRIRERLNPTVQAVPYQGVAYLINQFKRKEEVELLRTVYGPNFFQV